jgi:hypothetical protein
MLLTLHTWDSVCQDSHGFPFLHFYIVHFGYNTVHNSHGTSWGLGYTLMVGNLQIFFGIPLHVRLIYYPPFLYFQLFILFIYIFNCLFTTVWTHGYLLLTLGNTTTLHHVLCSLNCSYFVHWDLFWSSSRSLWYITIVLFI